MSIRSRCSSAPPSESGYDNAGENLMDWDVPDKPDEGKPIRLTYLRLSTLILLPLLA